MMAAPASWLDRRKSRSRAEVTVARRAMACEFSITLPGTTHDPIGVAQAALDTVDRLEDKLSVYRPGSEISRLNRSAAAEPATTDAETFHLLRLAERISAETGRAYDAASGALVRVWGFLHGPRRVPADAEIRSALACSGSAHVRLDARDRSVSFTRTGVELNLGGIGKGFAIDRALAGLAVRSALMQGGRSSIRAVGEWPVQIGRHARVWLRNQALGTSDTGNRFFILGGRRYGHILDPRSGWPAAGLLSASVIAPTAAEADALSTAFFVLGPTGAGDYCRRHPTIGAVLVVPRKSAPPEIVRFGGADVEVL